MPFKLNQDRRRHIPEQKRKVANWRDYDEGLRRRGSLVVWFSDEAVRVYLARGLSDVAADDRFVGEHEESDLTVERHDLDEAVGWALAGRIENAAAVAGVLAAYAYGLLMNLSGWPFVLGIGVPGVSGDLTYVPGAPLGENLVTFLRYTLITSTGSFDTGRAITNAVAIALLGPAVLATLRRTARRATVVGTVAGP